MERSLGSGTELMDPRLEHLAKLYGIEPGYHDVWGQWRAASDVTVRALLAAMGVDAHDPTAVEATLAADERDAWSRVLAPITVLRASELGAGGRIHLLEASLARPLAWRITGDYYNTNYKATNRNFNEIVNSNGRISTGPVIRF